MGILRMAYFLAPLFVMG